jgi:Second Messenger Oligonucleotide or Dinucleotide Synthetase domain
MAVAPIPLFTESFEAQIDDLLARACTELQLDNTRFESAERSYLSVGKYLESQPFIVPLHPSIFPQGSMALGTTVKPLSGDEYDLDLVCRFSCPITYFTHPVEALDLIERTLRSSKLYGPMVERKKRCIRLNYEHEFHLDILPACADSDRCETCLLVPDRELGAWTPTNPKGYVSWFGQRAQKTTLVRLMEKAEPIPKQEPVARKAPLKLSVQLLKRRRDILYGNDGNLAPLSIIITTLAAENYGGEESVSKAVGNILTRVAERIQSAEPGQLLVLNPTNLDEDLSDRWNTKPAAYREFVNYVTGFRSAWASMLQTRSIDKIAKLLERLFGEQLVKKIVESQIRDYESARSQHLLGVKRSSGIITLASAAGATPIRPNTFFGDEE